jgi:hypothetical protein
MSADTKDLKNTLRKYFINFLQDNKGEISSNEFELLSKFENYIFKQMSEE